MANKIRFAVIGVGGIGRLHVKSMQELDTTQVTALCNRQGGESQQLAQQIGAAWESDYQSVVKRDDVDAVTICTPSGTHMDIALAAIQAGKHVLVEKPIEITLPRIDRILNAATAANVKLGCMFQTRMRRGAQHVRRAVNDGRLGKLLLANAFVQWHRSADYYNTTWRGTLDLDGGGALINQAIHSIDLLQWLAGPVDELYARTNTMVHTIEAEDTASAMISFANGAQGVIQAATSLKFGHPARVELHGSKGSIILQEGRIVRWKLDAADEHEEAEMLALEQSDGSGSQDPTAIGNAAQREQIADFVDAILQNRSPLISGDEARHSVEIIRAIYHSSKIKQSVRLPYIEG